MNIKQGEENTEFVKDKNQKTENYIFQKNAKTKFGFTFIIITLAILISSYFGNAIFL